MKIRQRTSFRTAQRPTTATRLWWAAGLVAAIAVIIQPGMAAFADDTPDAAAADAAAKPPPVKVIKPDDLKVMLEKHRGKVVVMNLWATWCPPCVHEMPEFAAFYKAHRDDKDIVLLSVSADAPSEAETLVQRFADEKKLPFPIYVIDAPSPTEIMERIDVGEWSGALPGTFVYAKDGTLKNEWYREITRKELDEAIAPLRDAEGS